jgi:hypothetical protein
MPSLYTIGDEKTKANMEDDIPVVIAQVQSPPPRKRSVKKYVILSVTILLAALIILAAILIGMYFFTKAQMEIVKYSLKFDKNTNQDVTSDPNENIVQYQMQNPGQKAWIVNDFNKDIQVVKIQTDTQTNCYVSALNRTRAMEPSKITGPETKEVNKAATLTYVTSGSPISDTSFLAKAAQDICKGVSTYWLYPHCSDNSANGPSNIMPSPTTMPLVPATTRQAPVDNSPWYVYWYYPYNANISAYCVTGCCKTVCACSIDYYWVYSSGSLYCTWVASNCPGYGIRENPISQSCTDGPTGLDCPNFAPARLPDC